MNNPLCPRAVVLHLDVSCKWNRPATHAAQCKEILSFCICFPRLVGAGFHPSTTCDGLHCWWGTMGMVFFCPGSAPPSAPRRPRCSRAQWPRGSPTLAMFSADQFHCFPAFLCLLAQGCCAGPSCLEESEVLAASPAQVPRLSAARSRAWEGTSSHPFKPALGALRKVYFLTSEHPSPYHQNKDISNPCFQLLRC